jgi:hypothetical protein
MTELKFNQLRDVESFMPRLRKRVGEIGLAAAMLEGFERVHLHLEPEGDTEVWQSPGSPAIAVGDHSQGLESLLIIGASGLMGRGDISVTAKPYALTGQIVNALTKEEGDTMIGLIPGAMAKERKGGDLGVRLHRAAFKRHLPSGEAIKQYNAASLENAASRIEHEGGLVTIFPTGGVYDAATTPWRNGVGHLATSLSPEAFAETQVAPFRFDGVSPRRILQAVLLSAVGYSPKQQIIPVTFGKAEPLGDIFFDRSTVTPARITQTLQQRYQQEFEPKYDT